MKNPVEKYYDKLAPVYDQATAGPGAWTPPGYIAKELKAIGKKYDKALIVGVATGQDIETLDSIGVVKIDAVDVSGKMLAIAALKFPKVSFQKGDFMLLEDFKENSYDLIVCSGTLEFVADFEGFFEKCFKLLKKGGDLIVTYEPIILNHKIQREESSELGSEISKDWGILGFVTHRHSPEEFLAVSQKAGFALQKAFKFIAYKKLGEDIIYNFAHLKK